MCLPRWHETQDRGLFHSEGCYRRGSGELAKFVNQNGSQQSQGLCSHPKGKQKVKGTIHVIVGTNEQWVGYNTKMKAHMRSVMSVNALKKLRQQET